MARTREPIGPQSAMTSSSVCVDTILSDVLDLLGTEATGEAAATGTGFRNFFAGEVAIIFTA